MTQEIDVALTLKHVQHHSSTNPAPFVPRKPFPLRRKQFWQHSRPLKRKTRPATIPIEERKTFRTVMKTDKGEYVTAKLNVESGEVCPYPYKVSSLPSRPKAKANSDGLEPPWVRIPCGRLESIGEEKKPVVEIESRKKFTNPLYMYLMSFETLEEAIVAIPVLDNLIEGVLSLILDEGGTRKLDRRLIFNALKNLEVISSETVRKLTGYGVRHSQRVGQALRIVGAAFARMAEECS